MNERELALRWERKRDGRVEADRALVLGSSRVGKSTLIDKLIQWFQEDHCAPAIPFDQRGRIAVADEKPRFRATAVVIGPSIKKRYRYFVKGDTIANSVVLDHPNHWHLAWDPHLNPWQTVVVQAPDEPSDYVVWLCQYVIDRMYLTQRPQRPTLVATDEGLSFFGPTGLGRHGSAIQRAYRAGGEKGLVSVLGSQRPTQISPQTKTESNVHFLFRLNSARDAKSVVDDLGLEPPPYMLTAHDRWRFWAYRDSLLLNRHGRPFMLER